MHIILLNFSDKKSKAPAFMQAHNKWLQSGFDDDVFLFAGSIQPNKGGVIIANNIARETLCDRIAQDPFIQEGVVEAEFLEVSASKVSQQLQFLLNN